MKSKNGYKHYKSRHSTGKWLKRYFEKRTVRRKNKITEKDVEEVITKISKTFDAELFSLSEKDLERYWHFVWDHSASVEKNFYNFFAELKIYSSFCRRWEEQQDICCVVERVRDKYIMPKIQWFIKYISINDK